MHEFDIEKDVCIFTILSETNDEKDLPRNSQSVFEASLDLPFYVECSLEISIASVNNYNCLLQC